MEDSQSRDNSFLSLDLHSGFSLVGLGMTEVSTEAEQTSTEPITIPWEDPFFVRTNKELI